MGGGRKRGRTQRRHFKQGRENVWKHNPQCPAAAAGGEGSEGNATWQPFATENPAFEEYYKEQRIVPEEEWDNYMSMLRKPLPATFRINARVSSLAFPNFLGIKGFAVVVVSDEHGEDAIRPLPWYPGNFAWHLNFSRMELRRNQALESFHEFLKRENEVGNITRQEAVSMVPPLFLNVEPDHHILDMCAAPGSKTFQLLEMIHQSTKPGLLPNALVVANDVDVQRCNLLIHQTKRMCTANLIVTNHEAQNFPGCNLAKFCSEICTDESKLQRLEFDRVLCDVPCSGDGTFRKAPDLWRKWNAGMGNGLHRLQVEIAMRGIGLLKVGGRMVYSTCSMNPIENEAVVAEILRRCGDSVKLLDVSDELPELARRPGLSTWKVRDRGSWFGVHEDVPRYRKNVVTPSMFPSGKGSKDIHVVSSSSFEMNTDVLDTKMKDTPDIGEGEQDTKIAIDGGNNSGDPIAEGRTKVDSESSEAINSSKKTEKLEENFGTDTVPSEANAVHQQVVDANVLDGEQNGDMNDKSSKDKISEDAKVIVNEAENGQAGTKDRRRRPQNQGRWRGVDPVIFFKDKVIIESIVSFYGIKDSFPLEGHLERQSSKEGSPCTFRLSSEGLPLLLPYITKQILYASAVDFQHLLQYRTIKFPDFVDAKFGEEASTLLPGCCVVVLREGHQDTKSIAMDPSAIAIVCWKGKSNLCVMVSPLDGKELLERVSLRFGLKFLVENEKKPKQKTDGSDEQPDCATETDDQECLPESKASDMEIADVN
ncbi:hypothetical protein PR202_ga00172 [Eleusine coracana subsp. coracana]|uniref:SAM-dependent MTase RsmB/NOP-type domain-containing protein n=1 Tax=Eleusine coracana subsp. coracana TaxID=191504 RepID=A0AAV5BBE2_ELECO|nr:hypothetical protein PR202_ga00172 [Eleusine coracana subsp. coracana]